MVPWFITMGVVMLFGVVVQDRLMHSPFGQAFTFAVPIVALGYGVYRTMTLAPPAPHHLEVNDQLIIVARSDGTPLFRAERASVAVEKSAYTMHSKYGSYTFPVLDLSSGEQHARLCVWDNRPEFAFSGVKAGKNPHHLVAPDVWPRVVALFDELSRNP
jgi:hypothetical protein